MRWLAAGAALGALGAAALFAPAAWLAAWVDAASAGRLLLADARGTLWSGSATPVLTGGAGSRDASALPGRLHWRIGVDGKALLVRAEQACCLAGVLHLRVVPGFGSLTIELPARAGSALVGQWPAAWLAGLGTPWNTLEPAGSVQLASPGLVLRSADGRWRFGGRADIELVALSSRLSTLDVLGSYRLTLSGSAEGDAPARLTLRTTSGPLLLDGSGELARTGLRLRGTAGAAPGQEGVLNNLLNIIGRRQGATAIISIG
ncbi:MAG: type II secretion system protein N [Burkholderiaceae bacterium]|nr:type II secretion system protein N [Burkholderiaceae bacterium]NLZ40086.1 type II secretion system protein N [Comamonadaceae bacterium]